MIEFTVYGKPVPQGSMRTFHPMKNGKPIMRGSQPVCNVTSANKGLKDWRKAIAAEAEKHWPYDTPTNEPLMVHVEFHRYVASRTGDRWDDTGPDGDKLMRAIFDGITKVITTNDARVVDHRGVKLLCDQESDERAVVKIESLNRVLTGVKETNTQPDTLFT